MHREKMPYPNILFVLIIYSIIKISTSQEERCQTTPILSTCRLPTNYLDRIDQNYYRKFTDVRGIPVLGTWSVSNAALIEASRLIERMLSRCPTNYANQIVTRGDRVVILGRNEKLHDLPEFKNRGDDRKFNELRGYNSLGVIVCAEENLLCDESDDYLGYNVCMHEFAHSIDASFTKIDPAYKRLVVTAYRSAIDDQQRLWANTYAASDPAEYFAELSVAWFDASSKYAVPGSFNGIWSRRQLKSYDRFMSDLLKRVYGDEQWRYSCADVCRAQFVGDFSC